jgi:hypothetical protein
VSDRSSLPGADFERFDEAAGVIEHDLAGRREMGVALDDHESLIEESSVPVENGYGGVRLGARADGVPGNQCGATLADPALSHRRDRRNVRRG